LKMMSKQFRRWAAAAFCSIFFTAVPLHAVSWFPLGPYGGDARSFAADTHDPKHLYLGTATGWMYESPDGGRNWKRLSQIERRNDLVIKQILTDPRNSQDLIVGAYSVDRPDGGIFVSTDGGHTWSIDADMKGQSVRALTRSASNPAILVAGTLQGVFRTVDDAKHWTQISPKGSTEIHEVESLAVDPKNPAVIYAGTWHLPWKTVDAGAHWQNIKQGIIEDSDVFSILIDPQHPQVVYASACSGIYKSMDGAAEFKKIQGIPSTARRTRKLMQDPQHLQTVYAGTTEGLYRSLDGGAQWDRLTGPNVIVNDVYVDPTDSGHVLLATDRGGVLSSTDFAATFQATNNGFSARQVTAFAADPRRPANVYVGVVNDKESGGVFESTTGGVSWLQDSEGLGGRDIFSLGMTPDGVLLAGTNHGIFRLQEGLWMDSSGQMVQRAPARKPGVRTASHKAASQKAEEQKAPAPAGPAELRFDDVVYSLVRGPLEMFAGTSDGLLRSNLDGSRWAAVKGLELPEARYIALLKSTIFVAGLKQMALSLDGGMRWKSIALPARLTQISSVAVDDQKSLWVGGREGVFISPDDGASWRPLKDLAINQVDGIFFDAAADRILMTCANSDVVFAVSAVDHKVNYWDSGWKLRFVRPMGSYLLGATLYDGVVVQPKMVDSSVGDAKVAETK
jgi:photosystem II stability/assembly factor-like uncharacterized protein